MIQGGSGQNYRSHTLSVVQKRRSFNIADVSMVPAAKQVVTNEQLSQQMQHLGGTRLRGGLASPLFYNLYQSNSNFSNFYISRFDERKAPANLLSGSNQNQTVMETVEGDSSLDRHS